MMVDSLQGFGRSIGRSVVLAAMTTGMLLLPALAQATPEDDYKAGQADYLERSDLVGAIPKLRKAADAGHLQAQVLLAFILDYSEFDEDAIEYYRKAADAGSAEGQFGLGSMIAAGEGVKKDLVEGRKWILKAAEQGHIQAIGAIAQAYLTGDLAIPESARNGEEALRWIRLAAEKNYLPAMEALVKAYENGGAYGLAQNAALAADWKSKIQINKGPSTQRASRRRKELAPLIRGGDKQ